MRCYRFILIFIVVISSNAQAFQPKVEIIEQFDNLKMVAFINPEDINSNPEWNPNMEAPPLSVSEAIQAVKKLTKTLNTIKEIEIRTVPKYNRTWHYLIKVSNESTKSGYDIYVVLMNGKVIPGIIEPQGYK